MNKENALISQSLTSYLEAIYILSQKHDGVRITDIAKHLNISKPSVNRAVNALKLIGFVSHERYGDIYLTDDGEKYGKECHDKHMIIYRFFTDVLELKPDDAESETKKIEHHIGEKTIESMVKHLVN